MMMMIVMSDGEEGHADDDDDVHDGEEEEVEKIEQTAHPFLQKTKSYKNSFTLSEKSCFTNVDC